MTDILNLKEFLREKKESKEEFTVYQAKIGKDGKLALLSFPVVWTEPKERKNIWGVSLAKGKFVVPKSFADEANFKGNRNYDEDEIGCIKSSRTMSVTSISPHHALVLLDFHFRQRIKDFNKRMKEIEVLKNSASQYLGQISNKLTEVEKTEFDSSLKVEE